ncbi:mersacidin/lichenicidin family type 2 lantibiotic [Archangium minus]|uniref:Mersacidin/lichenicidin family type 2 lantibiotic n=1 Tax=Archangium minus TaxID=83450 RepID=A0ABY9WZD4_9BACT|nr:mersacidin/lichenicidin family type 2 lantibiotic [Archangium violaceum]WNG48496.1 mersacidin/lichenicidin family type 2 lantibiotic [Archangium minus]
MKKELIIRAWKDPAFRASLSAEERTALPESPAGSSIIDLDESELLEVNGGMECPEYSVDTLRCAYPTFRNCGETLNSCGIVRCQTGNECPSP